MQESTIDARGLPCPQPVVMAKAAIESAPAGGIRVVVDDAAQAENVAALARNMGWEAHVEIKDGEDIYLKLTQSAIEDAVEGAACGAITNVVVLVASDKFGQGADELGNILMRAFIKTVREVVPQPRTIVLVNTGVKLAVAGSELLSDLELLVNQGVQMLACGTCLDYFSLKDKLAVGKVSNMFDIATALLSADRVVRL